MYIRQWTMDKEAIFNEHVGKMTDLKLAKMLHVCVKWLAEKRRGLDIPPFYARKYMPEHKAYINEHYKTRSNRELVIELSKLFPDTEFKLSGIKDYLRVNDLIRSYKDYEYIRKREVESGHYAKVVTKRNKASAKHQPGEVYWHKSLKDWVIYVHSGCIKNYKVYVWEQHNGPLPRTHYLILKDPDQPITIDNIELVKKVGKELVAASRGMSDSWVLNTMMHNKSELHRKFYLENPMLIENQRLILQALREIKSIAHANKNRKLAQTPQADA